jgi:hypothetical protein
MKIYQKNQQEIAPISLAKANILTSSLLILFFLFGCSENYQPEKIYVPKNYIGWLYVIYNQREGAFESDGGYRVYHIPQSGILLTQYGVNQGWVGKNQIQIYRELYDSKFEQIPNAIDYVIDSTFKKINKNKVFGFSLSGSSCGKYIIYPLYIDTLKNWNKYREDVLLIEESTIDSLKNKEIR